MKFVLGSTLEGDFKENEASMIEKINALDIHKTEKHNLLIGIKHYNLMFKNLYKLTK